ncbi:MAG: polysaccharide biosynthesis/export family protein [Tepidisphaeraceae bacterium]
MVQSKTVGAASKGCRMGLLGKAVTGVAGLALLAVGTGCESNSFMDPSEGQLGVDSGARIVPILDSLTIGIDESNAQFAGARDVKAADTVATPTDYKVGPGDLLQINVPDLLGPGLISTDQKRVSDTGWISLQYVGKVDVSGLTEPEVQDKLAQAYKDKGMLQDPQVSVTVMDSQNRLFTITGAVNRGGPYGLPRSDYRLLDALATAGGRTSETGIDYVYIIRKIDSGKSGSTTEPTTPGMTPSTPTTPGSDPLLPQSAAPSAARVVYALFQPTGDTADRMVQPEGAPATAATTNESTPATPVAPADAGTPATPLVPATPTPAVTTEPPVTTGVTPVTTPNAASSFEFAAPGEPADREIIKVPVDQLLKGALKYNVVIKPNDMIVVPSPTIGEYYMGGHVQRVGVYSLTGRRITLTQALISAGMLDQVAIPARTRISRRLDPNHKMLVRVDLERIYAGLEPDIVLKPDDEVHVGTNFGAPFLAAIRNGFRASYGFGFIYDRNYASSQQTQ